MRAAGFSQFTVSLGSLQPCVAECKGVDVREEKGGITKAEGKGDRNGAWNGEGNSWGRELVWTLCALTAGRGKTRFG